MDSDYEIRVKGRLSPQVLYALEPLQQAAGPASTLLVGHAVDQAALLGIIAKLEAFGLEVLEVRKLPEPSPHVVDG